MNDDLVKRLRGWPAVIKAESIMLEAADRIEALTAERDALAAELRDVRMSELAALGQAQEAYEEQQALSAEVERLREALEAIVKVPSRMTDADEMDRIARAALEGRDG